MMIVNLYNSNSESLSHYRSKKKRFDSCSSYLRLISVACSHLSNLGFSFSGINDDSIMFSMGNN